MKNQLFLTTCLFLAGACDQAFGQQAGAPSNTPQTASSTIEEVIVTAERRTQSVQKSSLAIEVLSSRDIQSAGVTNVRDITSVLPGVIVGQGGAATQIYVRGIGDFGSTATTNPAVATYVDGVYVARPDAIEGNLYDVTRVEVLKGPQGTLYGRNSLGGTINILTNEPVLDKTSSALNAEFGSYNEINADGMVNVPLSAKLAMRAAVQVTHRDGYSSEGFDDDRKESGRLSFLAKPNDDVSLRIVAAYTHVGGKGAGYDFDTINFPASVSTALSQLSGAGLPAGGVTVPTNPRLSITDPRVWNVIWGVERLGYGERTGGPGEVGPFSGVSSVPFCLPAVAANTAEVAGHIMPLTFQNPGLCGALYNGSALAAPPGGLVATWDPSLFQQYAGQDNRYWNVNGQLDWNLGFANLTILPAYRRVDDAYTTYPGAATFVNGAGISPEVSEDESFEARLANNTRVVDWLIGAYYFHERQYQDWGSQPGVLQTGFLFNTINPTKILTNNYAVFGQGNWHINDQLRLITGLRYTSETKRNSGYAAAVFPSISDVAGQPCYNAPTEVCVTSAFQGSITSSDTNWKVGGEYDLTPQNMLYATVATGFKAGGLNTTPVSYPTNLTSIPYKPETLTAYELGLRNRFLDQRLQVNIEGFYWLYKNHQENTTYVTPAGALVTAIQNAGAATLYGADLSIVAQITSADIVRFDTEYNHSEYTNFTFISSGNNIPGIDTGCAVSPGPGAPGATALLNCKGLPLAQAPLWSGSASWTHTLFSFADGGRVDATLDGQYSDKRYLSNYFTAQVLAPSYFVVNLNATYYSPSGKWSLGVFGRNLSDEAVYTGAFAIRGLNHTIQTVNVGPPRTFGARLSANF